MIKYGCPYKNKSEVCSVTNESVKDFVMCECDWESCADFRARSAEKSRSQNDNELYGEEYWANVGYD